MKDQRKINFYFNQCKRLKLLHKKMLNFGEIYVKKHKFHNSKEPSNINDADIEHILVSNKNRGF